MTGVRRPFALLGGCAYGTLTAAVLLGADFAGILAVVCAGAGAFALAVLLVLKRLPGKSNRGLSGKTGPEAFVLFLGILLMVIGWFFHSFARAWQEKAAPADALKGVRAQVRAVVLEYPRREYHRNYFLAQITEAEVDGVSMDIPPVTVQISSQLSLDCQPYDELFCTLDLAAYESAGGLYSVRNIRLADGIVLRASLADYRQVTVLPVGKKSWKRIPVQLRRWAGRSFARQLPAREAGLIRTMLLGERALQEDTVTDRFRKIGAAHLLVISGLHMAAVTGLFGKILPGGRRLQTILTFLAVLGFLFLIGLPVAAVRSGLMYLVFLAGKGLGRPADGLNSLGFAVFLLCLWNPFSGGDLGLALSVLSTLGILLAGERITAALVRPWRRSPKWAGRLLPLLRILGVSFAALLFTLPVQFLAFGGISLLAPVSSLLLLAPCTLLLYCAVPAAFLGAIQVLEPFSRPFCFGAGLSARLSLWLAEKLAALPGTFVRLEFFPIARALGTVLAFLFFLRLFEPGTRRREALLFMALSLLVLCCPWESLAAEGQAVTLRVAANSGCVLISQGNKGAVLALGGYRTGDAAELLARHNIRRLEALCLPIQDSEAREAARKILADCRADQIVLPQGAYWGRDLTEAGKGEECVCLADGESITLWEGATVQASHGMKRLTVAVGAGQAVLETGFTGPGACRLLVTNQTGSQIDSAITVLQNDRMSDIIGLNFQGMASGRYVAFDKDELAITLKADGSVRFS